MPEPRLIRIADVLVDRSILPRLADPTDADGTIARYAANFDKIDSESPIRVQAGTLKLIGGHHRLMAARLAGREFINAIEEDIADSDLEKEAWEDNAKHGKAYTRTQWVEYFKLHFERGWWTDQTPSAEIERLTGLGSNFVRKLRREALGAPVIPPRRAIPHGQKPTSAPLPRPRVTAETYLDDFSKRFLDGDGETFAENAARLGITEEESKALFLQSMEALLTRQEQDPEYRREQQKRRDAIFDWEIRGYAAGEPHPDTLHAVPA